jgi:hypothetical protein
MMKFNFEASFPYSHGVLARPAVGRSFVMGKTARYLAVLEKRPFSVDSYSPALESSQRHASGPIVHSSRFGISDVPNAMPSIN